MPYQNLENGLYVIEQAAEKNGIRITHFGVLDVGNTLEIPNLERSSPVVIHQTPPNIRTDYLENTGAWSIRARIEDVSGALQRIRTAAENPEYDLFGNNCEHFARFVAQGERYSNQIFWGGVALVALGAFAVYALRD